MKRSTFFFILGWFLAKDALIIEIIIQFLVGKGNLQNRMLEFSKRRGCDSLNHPQKVLRLFKITENHILCWQMELTSHDFSTIYYCGSNWAVGIKVKDYNKNLFTLQIVADPWVWWRPRAVPCQEQRLQDTDRWLPSSPTPGSPSGTSPGRGTTGAGAAEDRVTPPPPLRSPCLLTVLTPPWSSPINTTGQP